MGLEISICLIWPLAYSQFSFIYEYIRVYTSIGLSLESPWWRRLLPRCVLDGNNVIAYHFLVCVTKRTPYHFCHAYIQDAFMPLKRPKNTISVIVFYSSASSSSALHQRSLAVRRQAQNSFLPWDSSSSFLPDLQRRTLLRSHCH